MKEKMNQFARGIFDYQTAGVQVTPGLLKLEVEAGSVCEGSFAVANDQGRTMKGVVTSDAHSMEIVTETFVGIHETVSFRLHGETCEVGEKMEGTIRVLSDCGVAQIPFSAQVIPPSFQTSQGKIRDLTQFATLAKEAPAEAVRVFGNRRFPGVFLDDAKERDWYEGLCTSPDKRVAVEEFLLAIHKKVPVTIQVSQGHMVFKDCSKTVVEQISIQKKNWGYGEYRAKSDSSFLQLEREFFTTDEFEGDIFTLAFAVKADQMHAGRNHGCIVISGAGQSIRIDVEAYGAMEAPEQRRAHLQHQECAFKLTRALVDWASHQIGPREYSRQIHEIQQDYERQAGTRQRWIMELFQIHEQLLMDQDKEAKQGLAALQEALQEVSEQEPALRGAWLALSAMQDPTKRKEHASKIREAYQKFRDWRLLWLWIMLDEQYASTFQSVEAVVEEITQGVHQPLLYLHICNYYKKTPELLLDMSEENLLALHWGCRHQILGEELARRYAFLAGRIRGNGLLILPDLERIYEKYPDDDILSCICRRRMARRHGSEDDLYWYAKAVCANLKLTDLYESYIGALGESIEWPLPDKLLLYFAYNNHLSASKRALLYAYVIEHKQDDEVTYRRYAQVMEEFARTQMAEGRINANLAVIYEEFIREDSLRFDMKTMGDDSVVFDLPQIMFSHEIVCYQPDIVGVTVYYPQLDQEAFVPLIQGTAVVNLYTGQEKIFLADMRGNRYIQTVQYTLSKLLHLDHLAPVCHEAGASQIGLLLHLYEKAGEYHLSVQEMVEIRNQIMAYPKLKDTCRMKLFGLQMRHYFDQFQGELIDYHLEKMDWNHVDPQDRSMLIEYCGMRSNLQKGMEGIRLFGYQDLNAGTLLVLSSQAFRDDLDKEDTTLVRLGWHIFCKGKYDSNLLRYLCRYYLGSMPEMLSLWEKAQGFGLADAQFAERILAQALFTQETDEGLYEVFFLYHQKGTNKRLCRAYLNLMSYEYLLHNRSLPEELFPYMYAEVRVEENRPCLLAALKYLSHKKTLTSEEKTFADYNLHRITAKNIYFGFFQDFAGKLDLPQRILRERYVEYVASPDSDVKIFYRTGEGEQRSAVRSRTMTDMFQGIRVSRFVLFGDEQLEYWIQETTMDGRVTQSANQVIRGGSDYARLQQEGWYNMLDRMMEARRQGDQETLLRLMKEYAQKRETVQQMMRPLP